MLSGSSSAARAGSLAVAAAVDPAVAAEQTPPLGAPAGPLPPGLAPSAPALPPVPPNDARTLASAGETAAAATDTLGGQGLHQDIDPIGVQHHTQQPAAGDGVGERERKAQAVFEMLLHGTSL